MKPTFRNMLVCPHRADVAIFGFQREDDGRF